VSDIYENNVLRETQKGLDFIQFKSIVDLDVTVFIKPNLTDRAHKPGITVTPLMIKTVVEAIAPLVATVFVGESDRGNYSFAANESLLNHRVYDVAEQYENVNVVNL
jgi:hypothetical protein